MLTTAPCQFPEQMASSRSRTRTASVYTVETAQGTHSFKITRYSLLKQLSVDKCFPSAIFSVGRRNWRIRYCHDRESLYDGYDSVFLELITDDDLIDEDVRAIYTFRMVNPATGVSLSREASCPEVFNSQHQSRGFATFIAEMEVQKFVHDGCLLIECDLTVLNGLRVEEETADASDDDDLDIQVPPSDLSLHLGRLLESEEEADVAFKVGGEVFHAHKIVLAMRSPVFKVELYGPMSGKGSSETRAIQEMDPPIFRALLNFIYTDSFPPMDDLVHDEQEDMVKHLLVAADRYGMERMKLICESILCKSLGVDSVADTLALAAQHHCSRLKDACFKFIISSDGMDDVLASHGYEHLKRACPEVAVELWEKTAEFRMARSSSSKSTYQVLY